MDHRLEWRRVLRPPAQEAVRCLASSHFVPSVPAVPDDHVVLGGAHGHDGWLMIHQEAVIFRFRNVAKGQTLPQFPVEAQRTPYLPAVTRMPQPRTARE